MVTAKADRYVGGDTNNSATLSTRVKVRAVREPNSEPHPNHGTATRHPMPSIRSGSKTLPPWQTSTPSFESISLGDLTVSLERVTWGTCSSHHMKLAM